MKDADTEIQVPISARPLNCASAYSKVVSINQNAIEKITTSLVRLSESALASLFFGLKYDPPFLVRESD